MQYYNRYQRFLVNGQQTVVPFVSLPPKPTDKRYVYKKNVTRLDKLSYEYYGTPYFDWLILTANPRSGGLESNIEDGSLIFIPFPLITSLQDYKKALDTHFFYYGR